MDIKAISLEFFGENIIVKLKEGSALYHSIGYEFEGRLTGRIWGDKFILNKESKAQESISTVIAIAISGNGKDIEVRCDEIESIQLVKQFL